MSDEQTTRPIGGHDPALAETAISGSGPQPIVVARDATPPKIEETVASSPRPERTSTPPIAPGDRLAHFRVERKLGEGGMGAVFVARDESLDRAVALKVLKPELGRELELNERFLREARAQARISHEGVVHIYFIGQDERGMFFAMELVDGDALDSTLDRGEPLEPEEARLAMIQVAAALREAHAAGFIHRDIKPSNLLRTARGVIKVADFGLAKPLEDDVKLSRAGLILGSPLYMAPEQARGDDVDHRADMYSLGASFHHLIVGEPAFDGKNAIAVMTAHQYEPAPSVCSRHPGVSPQLGAVVDKLLAKKPEDRFATYDELIDALEDAAPEHVQYAGFVTRAAAGIIDALVFGALAIALAPFIGPLGILIHVAYLVIGHRVFGQTLGKYAVKVRVMRADGSRISWGRALVRTLVSLWMPGLAAAAVAVLQGPMALYSTVDRGMPDDAGQVQSLLVTNAVAYGFHFLIWAAGFLVALFDPKKRALHDFAADTVVVHHLGQQKRRATNRATPSQRIA
ncbi:MAG: protein kinase, partial [Deltaproteobacteria bacterium]|nr:protein kinase [Deltaproteobacteria bacterium]